MNPLIQENKSKFVSVILASFNGQRFIKIQLESILNQTHTHLELIVVDDGSTDETLEIIKEYSRQDGRIHLFPADKNLGLVKNFERGLNLARGEFIVLADQDDIFHKYKIEKQLAKITASSEADMVISDLELIDDGDNLLADSMWEFQGINPEKRPHFKRLCIDNYATGCSMLFSRDLLDFAIPFPTKLKIHDQWLALLAARKSGGGIEIIREPLTRYRQHKGNVIGAKSSKKLDWLNIVSKFFSIDGLKTYHQYSVQLIFEKQSRVLAFLERGNLFTEQEISYLRFVESVFTTYLPVSNRTIRARLWCLPRAFYVSYFSRDFWRLSMRFILLTFFQFKPGSKT